MGSETHTSPVEFGTGSGTGAAAVEVETEKSRRALLKGLGVAAAGAVVGGVLSPEEAQADHGQVNGTSNDGNPAIHGTNTSLGPGVQGDSADGIGVFGDSDSGNGVLGGSDSLTGVRGQSNSGTGVLATSDSGTGVIGSSNSGTGVIASGVTGVNASGSSFGVDAISQNNAAVRAFSQHSNGVVSTAPFGNGVTGTGGNLGVLGSCATGGTGVVAQNLGNGLALNVLGPAKFSTAGAGTILANQNSIAVSNPAVTANSHITMTYTGNPGVTSSGTFAAVVWIERQPGTGFTARLSRRVTNATPFTYLIVEPG